MRTLSLREANQKFSSYIAEVEQGEHFVIERRGVPVAELIPYMRKRRTPAEREAGWQKMLSILDKGFPMGGVVPSKDEMHER